MVIYLYYYEGYTTDEISKILQTKSSTIRSRLYRARKRLKIIIEEESLDEGKDLYNSFNSIKTNDEQNRKC